MAGQEQGTDERQTSEGTLLSRRTVIAGLAAAGTGVLLEQYPVQVAGTSQPEVVAPGTGPRMGFVLSPEQFRVPELVQYGSIAEHAGFAWITLAAVSQQTKRVSYGMGVITLTFRYRPALVAEAFASLSMLSPGRVFLGLGMGEKLNEGAAGGGWTLYCERAARLVEAVQIIRELWSGQQVKYNGTYYKVDARLYNVPARPIPIYIAAGGPKSARLSGIHADGLIADPAQLKQNPAYKAA